MFRSMLYLLLELLEKCCWIEKCVDGYLIGLMLFELGNVYFCYDSLLVVFWCEFVVFVVVYNEVVQFVVFDGMEVVYIVWEDVLWLVCLVLDVGLCLLVYCCVLGKVLFVSFDDEVVCVFLLVCFVVMIECIIMCCVDLFYEFESICVWGLVMECEEVVVGLVCFVVFVGVMLLGKCVVVSFSVFVSWLDVCREKCFVVGVVGMVDCIGCVFVQVQ